MADEKSSMMIREASIVNSSNVVYSNNQKEATLITPSNHLLIRSTFLKKNRHIFNIKIKKMGHIGVGIVSPLFNVSKGSYIGQCTESYGSWDNICALKLSKVI